MTKKIFNMVFTKYINDVIKLQGVEKSTRSNSKSLNFLRFLTIIVAINIPSITPNFLKILMTYFSCPRRISLGFFQSVAPNSNASSQDPSCEIQRPTLFHTMQQDSLHSLGTNHQHIVVVSPTSLLQPRYEYLDHQHFQRNQVSCWTPNPLCVGVEYQQPPESKKPLGMLIQGYGSRRYPSLLIFEPVVLWPICACQFCYQFFIS